MALNKNVDLLYECVKRDTNLANYYTKNSGTYDSTIGRLRGLNLRVIVSYTDDAGASTLTYNYSDFISFGSSTIKYKIIPCIPYYGTLNEILLLTIYSNTVAGDIKFSRIYGSNNLTSAPYLCLSCENITSDPIHLCLSPYYDDGKLDFWDDCHSAIAIGSDIDLFGTDKIVLYDSGNEVISSHHISYSRLSGAPSESSAITRGLFGDADSNYTSNLGVRFCDIVCNSLSIIVDPVIVINPPTPSSEPSGLKLYGNSDSLVTVDELNPNHTLLYYNNGGWVNLKKGSKLSINSGKSIYLKGNLSASPTSNFTRLKINGNVTMSKNISYLYNGSTSASSIYANSFREMFKDSPGLKNISGLIFPNATATDCYRDMFRNSGIVNGGCTLPATTLSTRCYYEMFRDCSSMTTQPTIAATTLAEQCCAYMFAFCSSLLSPKIPKASTVQHKQVFLNMYESCTSLNCTLSSGYPREWERIIATTITSSAIECFRDMFKNCDNMTIGPWILTLNLPVDSNNNCTIGCFRGFFYGCDNLKLIFSSISSNVFSYSYYDNDFNALYSYNTNFHLWIYGIKNKGNFINTSGLAFNENALGAQGDNLYGYYGPWSVHGNGSNTAGSEFSGHPDRKHDSLPIFAYGYRENNNSSGWKIVNKSTYDNNVSTYIYD